MVGIHSRSNNILPLYHTRTQQTPITTMLSICFLLLFLLSFVILTKKSKKIPSSMLTMLRVHGTKREVLSMEQHLPQELVSNILSRLPAKDLVKCKRVCKSWFDLITDYHFVTNHYVAYNNLHVF